MSLYGQGTSAFPYLWATWEGPPLEVPSTPCDPTELLPGIARDKRGRPVARLLPNGRIQQHVNLRPLPVPCLQTPSPQYAEAPLLQEFAPRTGRLHINMVNKKLLAEKGKGVSERRQLTPLGLGTPGQTQDAADAMLQLAEKGKAKAIDPGMDDLEDEHEASRPASMPERQRLTRLTRGTPQNVAPTGPEILQDSQTNSQDDLDAHKDRRWPESSAAGQENARDNSWLRTPVTERQDQTERTRSTRMLPASQKGTTKDPLYTQSGEESEDDEDELSGLEEEGGDAAAEAEGDAQDINAPDEERPRRQRGRTSRKKEPLAEMEDDIDLEGMTADEVQMDIAKTLRKQLRLLQSRNDSTATGIPGKRKQGEQDSGHFDTKHMTKRIKQGLHQFMVKDYLFSPSRATLDKAIAAAAGRPVRSLQKDTAAYASYCYKINKIMKRAVQLAYPGLAVPMEARSLADRQAADKALKGERYRKSRYGNKPHQKIDEYGRVAFRVATTIAWAPGKLPKEDKDVVLEAHSRIEEKQHLTVAQIAYTELWVQHMLKGDMDVPTEPGPRALWGNDEVSLQADVSENLEKQKTRWYTLAGE